METNLPALITAAFLLLVLGAVLLYAARVAQPMITPTETSSSAIQMP